MNVANSADQLLSRYETVKGQIRSACEKSNRDPSQVKLMLVTKTIESDRIKKAIAIGHTLFGENKIQELKTKSEELADQEVEWHFIGHLQSNKVKECLKHASVIESVDRMSLVLELDRQLQNLGRSMDVLVQVNTSNEPSKFGLRPEETISFLKEVSKVDTLKVKGLMTLALFSSDEHRVRPCFRTLKRIFDEAKSEAIQGIEMKELSMGMSSDFALAVEEGATLVRVGQAVFGPRLVPDSHYWPEKK